MTYQDVTVRAAALLNDADQSEYTDSVQLPYLNMSLSELEEVFEQNSIPSTQTSSAVIEVPAGTDEVGFAPDPVVPDTPYLPDDLVEINELFESQSGQNDWVRVDKREYLTSSTPANDAALSFFGVWSWQNQLIKLIAASVDIDLKLDYVKSLFVPIDIDTVEDDLTIINSSTFLAYRTAALCAEYVAENPSRAASLNGNASLALDRLLGISTKGKQSIVYRRRPFRAAWKRRGILI